MQKINVVYYMRKSGSVPTVDFLNELNSDNRKKVEAEIGKAEQNRNYLIKHSKSLKHSDGLFEFRIRCKQHTIRLLYYYGKNHNIIITHGIIKRTQKTPESEKRVAEKYFKDWCSRGN